MKPYISIIISTYNSEHTIRDCIDSILIQSFRNFELIIVDDGSTDKTLQIVNTYNDSRIRLYENEHNYIQSLNKGISLAEGKYIARMDSDDIMLPNRLLLQYEFMESNPQIDICGGMADTFGIYSIKLSTPINHKDIVANFILGNSMIHPTVMLKKDLIKLFPSINGTFQLYNSDYIFAEDYKLWIDLVQKNCVFGNLPEVLIKYRVSDKQVSFQRREEMRKSSYRVTVEFLEYISDKLITENRIFLTPLDYNIKLFNEKKIKFESLQQIIYLFYKDFEAK